MSYIAYGIGQYYKLMKPELDKQGITISFLCDRKWNGTSETFYDGIPIIQKDEIKNIPDPTCIIFSMNHIITRSIRDELAAEGISYVHVDALLQSNSPKVLTGKELKESYVGGVYTDARNNSIYFDNTIPDGVRITFRGSGNTMRFGRNLLVGNLNIVFGNNGSCSIGDNTEVLEAYFSIAYADMSIGKDCLLATNVIIRTHDSHHIFDLDTHKRINVPKDVTIGDHVWVAKGVTLMPGASVGTGSVVAANTVTSSAFGEHCIVAGIPGKVIREKICWSKDDTGLSNNEWLEECNAKDALKYI